MNGCNSTLSFVNWNYERYTIKKVLMEYEISIVYLFHHFFQVKKSILTPKDWQSGHEKANRQ